MMRLRHAFGLVVLSLTGCARTQDETVGQSSALPPSAAAPAPIDLTRITLNADQIANIQKLPPEDQPLALAQKVCPVGEGAEAAGQPNPLGCMGVPKKVEVKGRSVFVCCAGCVKELEAEPDKFLAKLGQTPSTTPPSEASPAPPDGDPAPSSDAPANADSPAREPG